MVEQNACSPPTDKAGLLPTEEFHSISPAVEDFFGERSSSTPPVTGTQDITNFFERSRVFQEEERKRSGVYHLWMHRVNDRTIVALQLPVSKWQSCLIQTGNSFAPRTTGRVTPTP